MQKSNLYVNIIDLHVYTVDREFRLPYAYKSPNDKRQLIPINYDETISYDLNSYLITVCYTNPRE
jgi:hypothetical protein